MTTSKTKATAATSISSKPTCVLDNTVVNEATLGEMTDLGLSFFANLCGRNRGAFVLDPSHGHTWGCTEFPPDFAELATGTNASVPLPDANAIVKTFQGKNVTVTETLAYLDYLVKMVYHSTANVEKDAYACNTAGLSKLQCPPVHALSKIKAVATAGLFIPAPWATGGHTLTKAERLAFYTATDFVAMHKLGLNTVQIPFPLEAFATDIVPSDDPDAVTLDELTALLQLVKAADLQAIIILAGGDNDNAVTAAAHYAVTHDDVVFGVTIPSAQSLRAARAAEADLKVFVPINQGDITTTLTELGLNDPYVFGALDLSHTSTVADVASSTPQDDRMKLFYHESTACIARSPLEFGACIARVPILVSSGFDLAIDDCAMREYNPEWTDYGQCDRFADTINSGWWHRHRSSFAARQLFAYEQGMGWSFATWKLWNATTGATTEDDAVGVIDDFAKLLSFTNVNAAGLLPPLTDGHVKACLNPPESDFVMGDVTFAPTQAPVDCGYGWWNETIQDCSYWIPPPPTAAPTPCPEIDYNITCPEHSSVPSLASDNGSGLVSGGVGILIGIVIGGVLGKYCFRGRAGYSEIPSVDEGAVP